MYFYAFLTFFGGIKTCHLTCQKLIKSRSNDKKNLDGFKFVRLKTQSSHIDCFLTTLTTREILCVKYRVPMVILVSGGSGTTRTPVRTKQNPKLTCLLRPEHLREALDEHEPCTNPTTQDWYDQWYHTE